MSSHNLSLQDTIRDHRRELLEADWKAASLDRTNTRPAEAPFEIPEGIFADDHEHCDALYCGCHDGCGSECEIKFSRTARFGGTA
jgi:hypothetical protein